MAALLVFSAAVALAYMPAAAAGQAHAAESDAQSEAEQPPRIWEVDCPEARGDQSPSCLLTASVRLEDQNRDLLSVRLLRQPETGSLGLIFQVMHGAALPAGLAWQVDEGEAQQLAYQASDSEGVYVGISVGDDLLVSFRRGGAMRVHFVDATTQETITVTLPLGQFADAWTEFVATEREAAQ